jgi:hypothetical protein
MPGALRSLRLARPTRLLGAIEPTELRPVLVSIVRLVLFPFFVGPAVVDFLAERVGIDGLMLVWAGGFTLTAALVVVLAHDQGRPLAQAPDAHRTTLDRNPFEGFTWRVRSRHLLFVALLLAFANRAVRTQVLTRIDLTVNSLTMRNQLFATGRLIRRFGVTSGLLLIAVITAIAFVRCHALMTAGPILFQRQSNLGGQKCQRECPGLERCA